MNVSPLSRRLLALLKTLACIAGLAVCAAAQAAPTVYNFTTAPGPYGYSAGMGGLFSATDVVSGSFVFDPVTPPTGVGTGGTTLYGINTAYSATYATLAGTVAGYFFSDPRGFVTVGNDKPLPTGGPNVDAITFYADTSLATGTHDISGFSVGAYTLVNVRIFWVESIDIPDFLSDQNLPATPPTFMGRLALDFVPTDNPALPATSYVFFNGVKVTPAEPGTCN